MWASTVEAWDSYSNWGCWNLISFSIELFQQKLLIINNERGISFSNISYLSLVLNFLSILTMVSKGGFFFYNFGEIFKEISKISQTCTREKKKNCPKKITDGVCVNWCFYIKCEVGSLLYVSSCHYSLSLCFILLSLDKLVFPFLHKQHCNSVYSCQQLLRWLSWAKKEVHCSFKSFEALPPTKGSTSLLSSIAFNSCL